MKRTALRVTFDRTVTRAGNRQDWMRVVTLGLVVIGAFLLQGCLAGAWVAAVTVDSMKSSDVTFEPFEQSWVAQRDQSNAAVRNSKVTSVAVLPVEGDPAMRARLATILQQETTLRVESPAIVEAGVTETNLHSAQTDEADRSALAKEVTRDLGVDTVLVSRVTADSLSSHPSDWGRNTEGSRRLYLYLMNHKGRLLWKDELPFTLVKGSTTSQGASVQVDLSHHVMQHVKKLRLDELGYLPKKTF